jgi:TonB-dependent receptor
MDLFPTNLIDNIIVYKTFTPDLPADFTGGLVNIVTKDFPEQYNLSAGVRLGYNSNASFNNNFLTYQGSPTDFLGYDNGTRSLPSDAQGEIPNYSGNSQTNQSLTTTTESFNKIMSTEYLPSFMNASVNFSIGNQANVGKKGNQLGYVVGLSYKYNENLYTDGTKGLFKLNGKTDTSLNLLHVYNDNQGQKEALWGAVGNLTYKFSQRNKIGFTAVINHSGLSTGRYLEGRKPSDDPNLVLQTRVLQWVERQLFSGQLKGEHYVEDLSKMKMEWVAAASLSYQDEPDTRFFTNSYYPNLEAPFDYTIEPSIYTVPARYYRYMNETNFFGRLDFTFDIGTHTQAPKLKVGGLGTYKYRDFTETRIDYNWQFSATSVYNGDVSDFLADQNIGTNYSGYSLNRTMGLYVQKPEKDNERNSYTADQTVGAAYAMIDALVWDKLRIIGGFRYEYTQINSSSYDKEVPAGYLKNNDILPALGLTWQLKQNMNLRFNYGRTLARPSFRELAPYASENFAGGETWIGNDSLKRTVIDNIDLRWESFFAPGEVISIGAFYKKFTDPIEVVDNPKAQNPELTWQNVDQATVYGAELDFRKRLDFWQPLSNFLVGLNFTYIFSEVSKDTAEYPFGESTRPMFGQSPYITNAYLVYDNQKLGLNVNLVYNVSGPKLVINVKGITPDIYAQPFNSLNLTANKRIGEKWLIDFRVKNLLNSTYTESYQDYDNIYRQFKLGTTFEIGFKFSIN